MPQRPVTWTGLAQTIRQIAPFLPPRENAADEAQLYYRRACLAASEERYDVALIFCGKALEIHPDHLPTRLLVAQIHDRGLRNVDEAVAAYRKVIALSGYAADNPYCAAARVGLDALVTAAVEAGAAG
jgi:tetratricopeptide (TPR) repeat protein